MNVLHRPWATLTFFFLCLVLVGSSCKKDDPDPDPGSETEKVLVIENGARSINPDESENYSAIWVKTDGSVEAATSVTWSVEDGGVASISSTGILTPGGTGTTVIKAEVTDGGVSYSAQVPISISIPSLLAVAPSAIIYETGGSLDFECIYLGTSVPTFSFSSSDPSVASVTAGGTVTFNAAGSCTITVTASNLPNTPVLVPVIVIGPPLVPLLVSRVEITPGSANMIRSQSLQFSAQAYNLNGPVTETIVWSTSDASIASISSDGLVSAHGLGEVSVIATAQGISGQAEVYVSPDTIIEVTPFSAGIPAGGSLQFVAKAYRLSTNTYLPNITNFVWEAPSYGFPAFDFLSVNQSGLVSIDNNAFPGNLSFIYVSLANDPNIAGAAAVRVSLCDCGVGNSDVTQIDIGNASPISLSLFGGGMAQLNATAKDANGNVVANPALRFCSDDNTVASVDELTGEVFAGSPGTTTLRVCSGGYAESTITVNVTL